MKKSPVIPLKAIIADIESLSFAQSLSRVQNLISIYRNNLSTPKGGRRPVNAADVLRAATVLLHASLEDLLRGIAAFRIARNGTPEVLDNIPLFVCRWGRW